MEAMAAIVAGAATFMFFAYMVRARAMRPQEARLQRLGESHTVRVSDDQGVAILRKQVQTPLTRLLNAGTYAKRWEFELERADLKLRPNEYLMIRLALAAVTVLLISVVGRNGIAFIISLPLAYIMFMMPAYWVKFRTSRRIMAINKQLVETVELIAGALRAGFAFSQGIDVAAKRVGEPMSVELGRVLLDTNLGMSTEDALQAMNERIGSDDVDMVVTAILIQRQSGGNLAEVLQQVTETIRDRERIQGEIKTMTSQQQLTGWVLSLWPVLLGLAFFAFQPSIMRLFFTTGLGNVLLALWAGLWVLGVFLLRRILDIDI